VGKNGQGKDETRGESDMTWEEPDTRGENMNRCSLNKNRPYTSIESFPGKETLAELSYQLNAGMRNSQG
jgi:hypothetical protein